MRSHLVLLFALAGCASTNTFPVGSVDSDPLAVGHGNAEPEADPRWHEAREQLERLSAHCDSRREHLEREVHERRTESGVASALAVVAVVAGEVADTSGTTPGVSLGEARCAAPAGPTTTLPAAEQARAIPCGGMAAAGGGGPIAQRAIGTQLTASEQVQAMHDEVDAAYAWLDARRNWTSWSDSDQSEWDAHASALRALCGP